MPVGRPRKRTTEDVLNAALETFSRMGYRGASLPDLEAATGLKKGSLYKAFADKHDLYTQALDHYLAAGLDRQRQVLSGPGTPLARIDAWTRLLARTCAEGGCFAVRSAEELAAEDEKIRMRLSAHWAEVHGLLVRVLDEGQRSRSIRSSVGADDLASLLVRTAMGSATGARLESCELADRAWIALLELLRPPQEESEK